MSTGKQIVFGLLGVIFCVIAAGVMTGIRNTGSWAGFQDALRDPSSALPGTNSSPHDPTVPTPSALRYANTNLSHAIEELLAYATDQELAPHEMIYEANWPLEIKQLHPRAVRFVQSSDEHQTKGIFFILDRKKGHELGVVRWEDVRPVLVHPIAGKSVVESPLGGFRNLPQTNLSWHWHQP